MQQKPFLLPLDLEYSFQPMLLKFLESICFPWPSKCQNFMKTTSLDNNFYALPIYSTVLLKCLIHEQEIGQ